jgi:MoaA/NifB/PqqE/SkfB family radical SAM enzyme
MREFKDMGVAFVNLSGGEATQYPKFGELIKYLEELEMPFYLTTNGIISETMLKKIMANKALMGIKISIDGISEQSYLSIRDPLQKRAIIYKTLFKTLQLLYDNNIFVEAATLIHTGNINELDEYPSMLAKYGIRKWDLGLLLPEGRGAQNKDKLTNGLKAADFDRDFMSRIAHNSEKYGVNTSFGDINFNIADKMVFICGAGIDFMSIQADLSVFPCPLLPYTRFKELYGFRLTDPREIHNVWNSKQFSAWIDQKTYGCPTCALRNKCGRCIIQLSEEGKTDPYENISACYCAMI